MSIVLQGSTSGSITLQEPAVAGSTVLSLPATTGTVVVSGTTPSFNGITFPATQSASSDANTLDDYEEGTWTGTITGSVANPTTPVTATGTYTKIGRQVLARIGYNDVNTTGASGSLGVSGLPFTSGASTATGSVMFYSIGTGFSTANNISPYIPSTNTVFFYGMVNAGIWSIVTHNPGTARYLYFSVTYEV